MRGGRLEGLPLSRFPGAFPPPAFASRSCDARRGVGLSSRSAERPEGRTSTELPLSARSSYGRGGCLLYPGDGGAPPGRGTCSTGVCRSTATSPCTRSPNAHPRGVALYEASVGGLRSSPVRPAPRLSPPDGTGALGLPLERRTPPLPATHVERGARSSEHGPGTTRSHQLILQSGSSLVSCDGVAPCQSATPRRSAPRPDGPPRAASRDWRIGGHRRSRPGELSRGRSGARDGLVAPGPHTRARGKTAAQREP
jgi:hypothetical protein